MLLLLAFKRSYREFSIEDARHWRRQRCPLEPIGGVPVNAGARITKNGLLPTF